MPIHASDLPAAYSPVNREIVPLTTANFSYSAENRNVEFGLLIQDNGLATSIESTMASKHGTRYELA